MDIENHAQHTFTVLGKRAEDLHKWIDGYFDQQGFHTFLQGGSSQDYNPYAHRKHRHCREALQEIQQEFRDRYTKQEIKEIFYTHLQDDYNGYIPSRNDFDDPAFVQKYHADPDTAANIEDKILSEEELSQYFSKNYSFMQYKRKKQANIGFLLRIILPALFTLALFIAFIFVIIVPTIEYELLTGKKQMIRELANSAASIIHYYIDKEQKAELSRSEAQEKSITELQKMRYGVQGKDYFWITDMHPTMVMHPYRPELIGKDLTSYRDHEDKSGKALFKDAVDIVAEFGSGYLQYHWQWMDDVNTSVMKLSYVMEISEWGWVLGTGVYLNDIEEELSLLNNQLLRISTLLTAILMVVLTFVVLQSRKIENSRRSAEAGLQAAKERYRSLVEAANEAYLLVIDGVIIYSNQKMRQLIDYTEDTIKNMSLHDLFKLTQRLQGDLDVDIEGILHKIASNDEVPEKFSTVLTSRSGLSIPVTILISRVFFKDTNGYLFSIRELQTMQTSALLKQPNERSFHTVAGLIKQIRSSLTDHHAILCLHNIPALLYTEQLYSDNPEKKRHEIAGIYDAFVTRIIQLALEQRTINEVNFCFAQLGSNARGEITFFSDQDNAMIIDDSQFEIKKSQQDYFLQLSADICKVLNQGGFAYCPGGIMAVNPKWCLTLSQWYQRIDTWILTADAESILAVNVCADIECGYGDDQLVLKIKQRLFQAIIHRSQFLPIFAKHALSYHLPLNPFGVLSASRIDGEKRINIKECLKALEVAARLYALQYQIEESSTLDRLRLLSKIKKKLHPKNLAELELAFNNLWKLRFSAQLAAHQSVKLVNDDIVVDELLPDQRKTLQDSLSTIKTLQSKISFDFFGVDI